MSRFFFTSEHVENWIMCVPSQHSSFPGKDWFLPVETECFHFLSFSPSFYAFLVSLCAYFPPGSGTVKLLSSSRFGVLCHPKSLGLTGRVGGYWDTIQKARSEVISQSDVNSRGGRIWQWHCVWTPVFTAFPLKRFWHDAGHKISSHYILDSWNQIG